MGTPTQYPAQSPSEPTPSGRVALWDTAKWVVIALVAINHVLGTIRTQTETAFGIYTFSFFIHMPVMMLIAGYFAKTDVGARAIRGVVQLVAVWVVWECIWAAIRFFGEGESLAADFLVSPAWTLWFLVSLATMRVALPYIAKLRRPLLCSIVIALAAGISPAVGGDFSASRTLCFLPFFMLGWAAHERGWLSGAWFERPTIALRSAAAACMAGVALYFTLTSPLDYWRLDTWLRWRDSYFVLFEDAPVGDLSPEAWWGTAVAGITIRASLIALQLAMVLAVLLLVPRRHSIITDWGARTLYVYLLHAPIVWVMRQTGVVDAFAQWGPTGVIALTLMGLAITAALSTYWVARVTRVLIEPNLTRLLRAGESSSRHCARGCVGAPFVAVGRQDMTARGQR